jgi:hypothetical protein
MMKVIKQINYLEKCIPLSPYENNDWKKLDNEQEFIQNKRNKKDNDDKNPEGSDFYRNSSIIKINSQEFTNSTEKSSIKNEKKDNNTIVKKN